MKVNVYHFISGAKKARGTTVIIDVFRAFSCACFAIRNGADKVIPVGDIRQAYRLKKEIPDSILMGERDGRIQPGFDYGNSPSQIDGIDFQGKTIIQTTSAGTQGFANASRADELLSGSFVNADAVAAYIRIKNPQQVSIVCMGNKGLEPNVEDRLCGEYLQGKLLNRPLDFESLKRQILDSPDTQRFKDPTKPWYPSADLDLCLDLNRFNFVLLGRPFQDNLIALEPISVADEMTFSFQADNKES